MKIKLIWDAQFCGHEEVETEVPDDFAITLPDLFKAAFGFYDENCYYEVIR